MPHQILRRTQIITGFEAIFSVVSGGIIGSDVDTVLAGVANYSPSLKASNFCRYRGLRRLLHGRRVADARIRY
jgi:hypothetical protein